MCSVCIMCLNHSKVTDGFPGMPHGFSLLKVLLLMYNATSCKSALNTLGEPLKFGVFLYTCLLLQCKTGLQSRCCMPQLLETYSYCCLGQRGEQRAFNPNYAVRLLHNFCIWQWASRFSQGWKPFCSKYVL